MKKIKIPLYSIVSLSVLFALSLLGFFADRYVSQGVYFYTGVPDFTIDEIRLLAVFLGIFLLVSSISVFLFKNLKRKWVSIMITVVLLLISILVFTHVMIAILAFMPRSYVELISDDEEHHIVIAEDCYLFSPYGGEIYEKTSLYTMKKLKKYVSDKDFYTPFADGKYSVTWNENDFELFYDSDGDGELDERLSVEYLP